MDNVERLLNNYGFTWRRKSVYEMDSIFRNVAKKKHYTRTRAKNEILDILTVTHGKIIVGNLNRFKVMFPVEEEMRHIPEWYLELCGLQKGSHIERMEFGHVWNTETFGRMNVEVQLRKERFQTINACYELKKVFEPEEAERWASEQIWELLKQHKFLINNSKQLKEMQEELESLVQKELEGIISKV